MTSAAEHARLSRSVDACDCRVTFDGGHLVRLHGPDCPLRSAVPIHRGPRSQNLERLFRAHSPLFWRHHHEAIHFCPCRVAADYRDLKGLPRPGTPDFIARWPGDSERSWPNHPMTFPAPTQRPETRA